MSEVQLLETFSTPIHGKSIFRKDKIVVVLAAGKTVNPAAERGGGPGVTCYFGKHLKVLLDTTLEELTVDEGRLYRAILNQLRLVYQFNVQTYARAIIQSCSSAIQTRATTKTVTTLF